MFVSSTSYYFCLLLTRIWTPLQKPSFEWGLTKCMMNEWGKFNRLYFYNTHVSLSLYSSPLPPFIHECSWRAISAQILSFPKVVYFPEILRNNENGMATTSAMSECAGHGCSGFELIYVKHVFKVLYLWLECKRPICYLFTAPDVPVFPYWSLCPQCLAPSLKSIEYQKKILNQVKKANTNHFYIVAASSVS